MQAVEHAALAWQTHLVDAGEPVAVWLQQHHPTSYVTNSEQSSRAQLPGGQAEGSRVLPGDLTREALIGLQVDETVHPQQPADLLAPLFQH